MGCVQGATLLVDGSDEGRSIAGRQRPSLEAKVQEAGKKGCQNADLLAAAIAHGNMLCCMAEQLQLRRRPSTQRLPDALPFEFFGKASRSSR